jgi:hypothetical protein
LRLRSEDENKLKCPSGCIRLTIALFFNNAAKKLLKEVYQLSSIVFLLLFIAFWVVLNTWILPKMGVRT